MSRHGIIWSDSSTRPRTEHASVPLYAVTWDSVNVRGRKVRTGNSWRNQATAEKIYRVKASEGRNPQCEIQYCGGFL